MLACLAAVTVPVGVASFRMAALVVWPFGRTAVPRVDAGTGSQLAHVVWFVLCGWWLAVLHLATAFFQAITVIGIPNTLVSLKLIPVSCFPFGKRIASRREIRAYT